MNTPAELHQLGSGFGSTGPQLSARSAAEVAGTGQRTRSDEAVRDFRVSANSQAPPVTPLTVVAADRTIAEALVAPSSRYMRRSSAARRQTFPQSFDWQSLPEYEPLGMEEASRILLAAIGGDDDPALGADMDSLAVDDPRHTYDFADFMDRWREASMRDKTLPAFEPGQQPSMRLWRAPDIVYRRQLQQKPVDMQGLRWNLLGPSRRNAILARHLLDPSSQGQEGSSRALRRKSNCHTEAEHCYAFHTFTPRHRAEINHYQLRNGLAAVNRNEIYYACGDRIQRTSLSSPLWTDTIMGQTKSSTKMTSFRVTCLAASSLGVVVAGGFCGEYAIIVPESDIAHPTTGFVTRAYNGLVTCVHTFHNRRSASPQAVFCSNDRMLRLLDTANDRMTDCFRYDYAINSVATSPDSRLRALAGDDSDILITDADRGDILLSLKGHGDHAFACAWSRDGRHVATGAQDGGVLIWDSRNWSRPLWSFQSVVSCARSMQYTDDGALVIAEDNDIVRVLGRDLSTVQDISFFGSIAGVALLDGGTEMIVANADHTVGGISAFKRADSTRRLVQRDRDARGRLRSGGVNETRALEIMSIDSELVV